jgi:mannose-1-phosphate guanylyltransferase
VLTDEGGWRDLGSRAEYLAAHTALALNDTAPWIHPSARISPSAKIAGATAIGAGCQIGADARINDCILWAGAEIALGSVLDQCIVTDGQRVEGIHSNTDF